jgi:hypothetical protein
VPGKVLITDIDESRLAGRDIASHGLRHHPELLQGRGLRAGLPGRLHPSGGK